MGTRGVGIFASCLLVFALGCSGARPSHDANGLRGARGATAVSVHAKPEYLEAQRRFLSGNREGTLQILDALAKDESLIPSDRAFLERQIRIVKGEAGGTESAPSRRIPSAPVSTVKDCGPRALQFALLKLGVRSDLARLRKLAGTGKRGTNLSGLAKAAKGIRAEGVQMDSGALKNLRNPAVSWWGGDHFVALLTIEGESARIRDPNEEKDSEITLEGLVKKSGGIFLTLEK